MARNRQNNLKWKRRWYQKNRAKILAGQKRWRDHHSNSPKNNLEMRKKLYTAISKWKKQNRGNIKRKAKRYYRKNRARMLHYFSTYYASNKPKYQTYYLNKRGIAIARAARWRELNETKAKASHAAAEGRRRAAKSMCSAEASGSIKALYLRVYGADRIKCHWCKKSAPKGQRHIDHKIPISRGGPHSIANLVASCARCNQVKHNRTPAEFRRYLRQHDRTIKPA